MLLVDCLSNMNTFLGANLYTFNVYYHFIPFLTIAVLEYIDYGDLQFIAILFILFLKSSVS